VAVAKLVEFKP